MTKNILILALLIAAAAGYTVFSSDTVPQQDSPQKDSAQNDDGDVIPDFTFAKVGGVTQDFENYRGKAVVVNFWASWCTPCIVEFPQMIRLAEGEDDTVFLFLGVGETGETAKNFAARHLPATLPENVVIALDPDKAIAEEIFKTYKLPETYLVTPSLTIADKIIGNSVDWEGKEIREKIDALSRPQD